MRIGYMLLAEDGAGTLVRLAQQFMGQGIQLAGVVQHNIVHHQSDSSPCDMDLQLLPTGPLFRISQNLGAGSTGCRLDTNMLEAAVMAVQGSMGQADLVVINKFGKHEAAGRGFCAVIADALAAGLPVLIGVNVINLQAFLTFAGDLADELALQDVQAWVKQHVKGALWH